MGEEVEVIEGGITFMEMVTKLGLFELADPLIEFAYSTEERRLLETGDDDNPHGQLWHTSFHASSFPAGRDGGVNEKPYCGRQAIYDLMNVPSPDIIEPMGRSIMDAGKDAELQIMRRLHRAGLLISADPDADVQTGFVLPQFWLTGNTDGIMLPPDWNKGHVLETKGKDHDVIAQMRMGVVPPDPYHIAQLKVYIWMAHRCSKKLWPHLEPVTSGSLIYFSRARPRHTAEFLIDLDFDFIREGLLNLIAWKRAFLAGELPARPKGWRWTEDPCDWCAYKKHLCRPDERDGVTRIEDSALIAYAKSIRPDYDHKAVIETVKARWEGEQKED